MRSWQMRLMRWHLELVAAILPDASKLLSLRTLLAWATPRHPSRLYRELDEQCVLNLVRQRLAHPWRMRGRRCLREGLLCFYFLRLINVPAVLHFGVFAEAKGHEMAHCWVSVENRWVTEPPGQAFVPILTYPKENEW